MSNPTQPPETPEASDTDTPTPKPDTAAIVEAGALTGLSFTAAVRAADPDHAVFASFAWATAACIALLAGSDSLKRHGVITAGNFKPGVARSLVRVGAMASSLMAAEHMVANPENLAAFGISAAATLLGTAIAATTMDAPKPSTTRRLGM